MFQLTGAKTYKQAPGSQNFQTSITSKWRKQKELFQIFWISINLSYIISYGLLGVQVAYG